MFADITICSTIYKILNQATYSASIIDARGLNSNNTNMTCASGTTPWNNGANFLNKPSTILLPAGTIRIPATWVLPNSTRLVGQGENNPLSATPGTTIQASVPSLASMIQFGASASACGSNGCYGISVEKLTLDGKAQSIDGIINQLSQNNTYVDHVTIYQVLGTGLLISNTIGGSASNSGPYTSITFDTGGYSGTTNTVCAQILNVSGTKGIHGLRCKSENQDAPAAVLLDASNNSIEDVTIVGFYDGVLVGKNANAQSNVLINVIGDTVPSGATPVNTVHISNSNTVTDLGIVGLANMGGSGTYSLQDEVTGPHLSDPSVAIYALGESPSNGIGHSRFSTSPNVAHWTVGTSVPTSTNCSQGSLYSCTTGPNGSGCSNALWVCVPGQTGTTWSVIK